jgi:hypothetical protein
MLGFWETFGMVVIFAIMIMACLIEASVIMKQHVKLEMLTKEVLGMARKFELLSRNTRDESDELARCRLENINMANQVSNLKEEVRRLEREKYNG